MEFGWRVAPSNKVDNFIGGESVKFWSIKVRILREAQNIVRKWNSLDF